VTDDWEILENKAGAIRATMVIAETTDASDGTFNLTHPDPNDHAWDLNGCNQVLVGVEVAFIAGTGGATTTASLQAKVI